MIFQPSENYGMLNIIVDFLDFSKISPLSSY